MLGLQQNQCNSGGGHVSKGALCLLQPSRRVCTSGMMQPFVNLYPSAGLQGSRTLVARSHAAVGQQKIGK